MLPTLALTCGDPAGVGPEIAFAAARRAVSRRLAAPLLVGEAAVWRRAGWRPGMLPVLDTRLGLAPPRPGRPSAASGRLSFAAFSAATRLAARRLVDGIVTAPISKQAWDAAGVPFRDHTEYLNGETGCAGEMILGAPAEGLWCALATRHVPLARAPGLLSVARVLAAAGKLAEALRLRGARSPRLGLCGLNPHAGESGLLGLEERRVLAPAARRARRAGLRLAGPIAADAAWRLHRAGAFDGLVCLYHDQALIALKTAAGLSIVNWTVGLPFVRTSPGHGTAFDIAGRARADAAPMLAALTLAASAKLSSSRRASASPGAR